MTRNLLFSAVGPACIAFQLAALPIAASGQELFGGVGGVTRDSASKQPVAQVRITAHNVKKGTDRTAISGPDGTFTIARLEPGQYQVAAARDGFIGSTADVEVASPETYRVDFLLAAGSGPTAEAKGPAAVAPATVSAVEEELVALKKRIGELEAALHGGPAPVGTAPAPAPESAAPVASPAPAPQPAPPTAAPAAPSFPEALQSPDSTPGVDNFTPFAYGDFTWLNGNPRNKDTVLDTKYFTPEVRFDTHFMEDFNQPVDHTMGGLPNRSDPANSRRNKSASGATSTGKMSAAES